MAMTGMDIEAVRTLGTQMDTNAGEIEAIVSSLTSQLEGTEWIGPDRELFMGDWQSTYVPQLTAVVTALRDTANRARANADEQETASAN